MGKSAIAIATPFFHFDLSEDKGSNATQRNRFNSCNDRLAGGGFNLTVDGQLVEEMYDNDSFSLKVIKF